MQSRLQCTMSDVLTCPIDRTYTIILALLLLLMILLTSIHPSARTIETHHHVRNGHANGCHSRDAPFDGTLCDCVVDAITQRMMSSTHARSKTVTSHARS